jgi:glycosyltransferase involved in cell wall biosynthesis
MNILYLTDTGDIIGGGEISLLELLKNIDRSKFRPCVTAPKKGNFTDKANTLDIPVILIPLKKLKNPLNIPYFLGQLRMLTKVMREFNIDLVHSNSTGGFAFLGGVASYIRKIPFIWHVRAVNFAGIGDLIQSVLSTKVVVISEAVKKRFWWIPVKDKIMLVYNGVNLGMFDISIDRNIFLSGIGCKEDDFLIGTIGRFVSWKGYEYFLKAAKIVLNEVPNAKFLIVGLNYSENNKYLHDLKSLTKSLDIKDNIIFMGESDNIPEILSSLDLFVLPSIGEPFGRVLIEAMASGKPIVAFKSGGVPEIVEESKTGFLVNPRDFDEMAKKIIYFLKNRTVAEKFGIAGKKRAEMFFNLKDHIKTIESLYNNLAEKR